MSLSRRGFLKGSVAAALLAELGAARALAADQISKAAGAGGAEAYSLQSGLTYLNHASVGTIPTIVREAHARYLRICESNPWLYIWSDPWRDSIAQVRDQFAALFGCRAERVALTHNTTEVMNLVAHGLPLDPGDEVLFSSLNHDGASVCWQMRAPERGFSVRRFDFDLAQTEALDPDAIVARYAEAIGPKTRVLVLPHIDNIIGLAHPITALAKMARERGVRWIIVDGAQSAGMLELGDSVAHADVYAVSAHKWLQAPKGLGAACFSDAALEAIRPMWVTWGQERWHDARRFEDYGTRALPAVMALGDALRFQAGIDPAQRRAHHQRMRRHLVGRVSDQPGLRWNSPHHPALATAIHSIQLEHEAANEAARRLFAEHDIVVRPFEGPEINALRVSPNLNNTEADLDRLIDALHPIVT